MYRRGEQNYCILVIDVVKVVDLLKASRSKELEEWKRQQLIANEVDAGCDKPVFAVSVHLI